jgi:hypothetical protein
MRQRRSGRLVSSNRSVVGLASPYLVLFGASTLAKNVNDNAYVLNERVAGEFFASKLAPKRALTDWHWDKPARHN